MTRAYKTSHSCSEPFSDHAASRSTAKAKLVRRWRTQTFALADFALQGHGARKKLNSQLHEPFYAAAGWIMCDF